MNRYLTKLCEFIRDNGTPCGDTADWEVGVGDRKMDAQMSCQDHLGRTCALMADREGRQNVMLHVQEMPA